MGWGNGNGHERWQFIKLIPSEILAGRSLFRDTHGPRSFTRPDGSMRSAGLTDLNPWFIVRRRSKRN